MGEPDAGSVRRFYSEQSAITDPGEYAYLFEGLPRDVAALARVVQGLVVCDNWARSYGLSVTPDRRQELQLRFVPRMFARIVELDAAPLAEARPPERRLVGICRDFAVLLVSMLRYQGVPARLRVGFGGYFGGRLLRYWDHRIAEYWDEARGRWVLADPMIDNVIRRAAGMTLDTLDLCPPEGSGTTAGSCELPPFMVAGDVWQRCRAGTVDPLLFGDSPEDVGMPPIRYALLHDFDALNKVELVGFDAWHSLIDKPESKVAEDERRLLDRVAELTLWPDVHFAELQALYGATAYAQAVSAHLAAL